MFTTFTFHSSRYAPCKSRASESLAALQGTGHPVQLAAAGNRNATQACRYVGAASKAGRSVHTKGNAAGARKSADQCSSRKRIASSELLSLYADALRFLKDLADPGSVYPEADTRALIRQYLSKLSIPPALSASLDRASSMSVEDNPPAEMTMQEEETAEDTNYVHGELDDLLMHMSIAEDGLVRSPSRCHRSDNQNAHFGPTSFHWQTPSANTVARLQRQLAQEPHVDITRPHRDQWATDTVSLKPLLGGEREEAELLRSNGSMLNGWETCEPNMSFFAPD